MNCSIPVADNIGCRPLSKMLRYWMEKGSQLTDRLTGYRCECEWIMPSWRHLSSAALIVVVSEPAALALMWLRSFGVVPRKPTLYITMGLPEKLGAMRRHSPGKYEHMCRELRRCNLIVSVSRQEQVALKSDHGLADNTVFIPAGVDENYFVPQGKQAEIDVLTIGADRNRDFATFMAAAAQLPATRFRAIMSAAHASSLGNVPANVEVLVNVPMATIRSHLESSRIVALPCLDNTYSGATTVMLQAMAMERPVIANRIGANRSGYCFEDGYNCVMVEPNNGFDLATAISGLIQNPSKRTQMGHAARMSVVHHHRLEQFHEMLFAQYLKIIPPK